MANAAGEDVNIIFGTSINPNLGDEVVVTVIATGIDDEAEEEASKQLPGRGHQVAAHAEEKTVKAAPKILAEEASAPEAPAPEPVPEAPKAKEAEPRQASSMVDPTSVWGLNDDYDRRGTADRAEEKQAEEPAFDDKGQDSISQIDINTDYDDDDDDDDIPFFKHRRDR